MTQDNSEERGAQRSSLVGTQVEVQVEKMTVGGAGLARYQGLVIFVDFAAPGDTLLIEIIEHKKNLAHGKIVEILNPGPSRVPPVCRHYGHCGGCSWQHLSRQEQLHQKELILIDSLKLLAKSRDLNIRPIIPSPRSFQYRNRVQMTYNGQKLGFRAKRSNDLIAIDNCELVEEPLQKIISAPRSHNLKSQIRYDIRLDIENLEPQLTALNEDVEVVGFSQVNRFQNDELIAAVLNSLRCPSGADLYEFYAGSGNFTFPILERHRFSHVWAIEGSPALVRLAQNSVRSQNISNKKITFHLSDVSDFLRYQWPRPQDVVFLDPPRIGADEFVIKTLAQSTPQQIVYLSCHPVTLARDLQRLFSFNPSYKVEFIQPFEMFPQTDHLETLVSLSLTHT